MVVIESGPGVTVIVNPLDVVVWTLSVTVTVNAYEPIAVAVPLKVPFKNVAPGGVLPLTLKTNGGTPPVAANVTANPEPTATLLMAPVVMTRGPGTIVTEMVPEPLLFAESDAVTPKEKVPTAVGVPLISPLFATVRPGGKVPEDVTE